MKNFVKWFGIVAFAAVIGFSFTACKKDSIDGTTWKGGYEQSSDYYVLTFKKPNVTLYYYDEGILEDDDTYTGTYTISGNKITMMIPDFSESMTVTLSGNKLTLTEDDDEFIFIKQ